MHYSCILYILRVVSGVFTPNSLKDLKDGWEKCKKEKDGTGRCPTLEGQAAPAGQAAPETDGLRATCC